MVEGQAPQDIVNGHDGSIGEWNGWVGFLRRGRGGGGSRSLPRRCRHGFYSIKILYDGVDDGTSFRSCYGRDIKL